LDYHSVAGSIEPLNVLLAITPGATTILLFIVILLLLLSFFLAGSEVAFFSLSSKDINILKTRKHPSFRRIVALLEQPKILSVTLTITNVFVNVGIILTSNLLINDWLKPYEQIHPLPVWTVFLIKVVSVTFVMVLFAEVLPKIWATHHKVWFAAASSLIVEVLKSIFYGISKRFVAFSERIEKNTSTVKSAGMDDGQLDYAIDLLSDNEASMEEKQILKGIRKFSETTVKQIMRTRLDVSGIPFSDNFKDVLIKIEELHYSRLPVYKNSLDEIAGTIHTKDLLPYLNESADFDWHSLIRTAYFVHEQKSIEDLLQEFRTKRIHFAVVVDEFGGTSGIVTLEDIIEEIIGEIKDEFDDEENINKKLDENNYIFEGKIMINDVCKVLKIPVDTFDSVRGESDSLAGLVLEIAGEFPQINDSFTNGQFTFVPLEISKNRIDKVKVTIGKKASIEQQ
jgi:putative hemolysin